MIAADRGNELLRRAQGDEAAVIHDGDAVAEALGLVHVMGGEDDGAAGALQVIHEVPEMPASLRIEAGGGLVEEQQLGIADQRAGHGQALLLAAGKRAHAGIAFFFELGSGDDFVHRDAAMEKAAEKAEGFENRELFRELRFLELNADALAQIGGMVTPVSAEKNDLAGIGSSQAFADFDGGGFACAVGAEQAEAFAGVTSRSRPSTATTSPKAFFKPGD